MIAYYAMNIKGASWKAVDSAIGDSSRIILDTGINFMVVTQLK